MLIIGIRLLLVIINVIVRQHPYSRRKFIVIIAGFITFQCMKWQYYDIKCPFFDMKCVKRVMKFFIYKKKQHISFGIEKNYINFVL